MTVRRNIFIGVAALAALVGGATVAVAANSVSATLYGTDSVTKSTVGCSAGMWSNATQDAAATNRLTAGCETVTVRIYYSHPAGYAGWTATKSGSSGVLLGVSGDSQLVKSYHTAIARTTTAQ